MVEMSEDGKKILISNYENFTQLYVEDGTGNFLLSISFNTFLDLANTNARNMIATTIKMS